VCLIVLAIDARPDLPLLIAANRDERYDRPAAPLSFWADHPDVLGGRDLEAGGSWLAAARTGRFAAVTNLRSAGVPSPSLRSRGELVGGFVTGRMPPLGYLEDVTARRGEYRAFNLLAGEGAIVAYGGSRISEPRLLAPGVYGLSNQDLDTPWPKVVRARRRVSHMLAAEKSISPDPLFDILSERQGAPDAELPDTGVGIEWERALSPAFIVTPEYGTRASTVLLLREDGVLEMEERTFGPGGKLLGEEMFRVDTAATPSE